MQKSNPDAERGEISLLIGGETHIIRFGLKFLKALTDRRKESGPTDLLAELEAAPLSALMDIAVLGIELSVPAAKLPADFDGLTLLDELPRPAQVALFQTVFNAVTRNPLMEILTQDKTS